MDVRRTQEETLSQQPHPEDGPQPAAGHGPPAPGQQGQQQPRYEQPRYEQPGYEQPGYGRPGPQPEMSPADQRLWGMLAHLSAIVAALVLGTLTAGTVYLGALGPLVVYLVLKDRGVFVRRQAAEALNFQILATIVYLVGVVLAVIIGVVTLGLGLVLVVPVAIALAVVALVFTIIAAVRANQGVDYRYPITWRLVR